MLGPLNFEEPKILDLNFQHLSTFGIMREYSRRYILNLIENLRVKGYICYKGKASHLSLRKEAYHVLFQGEKVFLKKNIQTCDVEDGYDKALFSLLKIVVNSFSLRYSDYDNTISDRMLRDICIDYPLNQFSLKNIKGISNEIVLKYGDILLDNICDYVRNNDVDIHKYYHILRRNYYEKRVDSFIISCNLYNDGMEIDEISDTRGLTRETILNHLLKGYQSGIVDNIDKLVHLEDEVAIREAIAKHSKEGLKAIKEDLPEAITYFDIRYFLSQKGRDEIQE